MTTNDELLQPSLEKHDETQKPIYSATAGYLTAFVGGPFAAIAMASVNSWRLRRLAADAVPLLAVTAVCVGILIFLLHPEWFGQESMHFERKDTRIWSRVFGLVVFSAFWLLHRRYYRGMELMGQEPPNAWIGGIGCILAGTAVTYLLTWWLLP